MGAGRIIVLGLALGADAFSFSVALGTKKLKASIIFKLALLIGLFHIFMSLIGINLGYLLHLLFDHYYFTSTIDQITKIISGGILMILGMVMIHDRLVESRQRANFKVCGPALFILAVSVSFDALSVGVSLGILEEASFIICLWLGVISSALVLFGLVLGSRLKELVDKAEVVGGIVLILLGLRFILA